MNNNQIELSHHQHANDIIPYSFIHPPYLKARTVHVASSSVSLFLSGKSVNNVSVSLNKLTQFSVSNVRRFSLNSAKRHFSSLDQTHLFPCVFLLPPLDIFLLAVDDVTRSFVVSSGTGKLVA